MSFENFKPVVVSKSIQRQLEAKAVFLEDCNREYEGDIKRRGDRVRIPGIGRVTIHDLDVKDVNKPIQAPEILEDTSDTLDIDKIKYFNFCISNIDATQAIEGAMEKCHEEAAYGIADVIDKTIANLVLGKNVPKLFETDKVVVAGTASSDEVNVLDALDEALLQLEENNVPGSEKIIVTIPPRFKRLFQKDYIHIDTNNSEYMKHGYIGMYNNMVIKLSNNVANTGTKEDPIHNIMVRTTKAIAFAQQLRGTEAYRPDDLLDTDAVKGYSLFGTKVVRPKEIININVKYK